MKEMSNLHTHTHTLISDSFWLVKYCSLRGVGRRDWEVEYGWSKVKSYDYIGVSLVFLLIHNNNILVIKNTFPFLQTYKEIKNIFFYRVTQKKVYD